ncbi:DUF4286 family protein [Rhodopseudomonas palustris]|uniref:Uncharacterized protein n=1 Tax=Rhodopseudomonas palustris (strain BisB18) TaxID=316056 RepID=Q210I2_RHOPB
MPLAGQGMLLTSMDVDSSDEADFNTWYDREHLIERVAIEGFLEARRYVAHAASPKYLSLYSTRSFEVLSSAAYRHALANQTAWSRQNIARFRNMIRGVARITASRGQGRGAVLGLLRIRPKAGAETALRDAVVARFVPEQQDGILSMHLIENDPALSKPLTTDSSASGAADWFVLVDGSTVQAVEAAINGRFDDAVRSTSCELIASGIYRLLWDLTKDDLAAAG